MAIYGSFIHFVGLTMRKQNDRPKWREPPNQRPTKILSSHGQAQHEISAKTAHVCKSRWRTPFSSAFRWRSPQEATKLPNQIRS